MGAAMPARVHRVPQEEKDSGRGMWALRAQIIRCMSGVCRGWVGFASVLSMFWHRRPIKRVGWQ